VCQLPPDCANSVPSLSSAMLLFVVLVTVLVGRVLHVPLTTNAGRGAAATTDAKFTFAASMLLGVRACRAWSGASSSADSEPELALQAIKVSEAAPSSQSPRKQFRSICSGGVEVVALGRCDFMQPL